MVQYNALLSSSYGILKSGKYTKYVWVYSVDCVSKILLIITIVFRPVFCTVTYQLILFV